MTVAKASSRLRGGLNSKATTDRAHGAASSRALPDWPWGLLLYTACTKGGLRCKSALVLKADLDASPRQLFLRRNDFPESRSNHPQRDAFSDQRVEERYSPGHLSRDLLVLQEMIECPANDFVAFARSGFQPLAVDDLDSSASIPYEAPRLQRLCGQYPQEQT
jgi:hypothetical protein